MLTNWIKPFSREELALNPTHSDNLASQIITYKDSISLNKGDLCILGIGKQADGVRKFLYQYAPLKLGSRLIDLGNIRQCNSESVQPVLKELQDAGIGVLLIDAEGLGPKLLFDHFNRDQKLFNPVIVDEFIRQDNSSFDISYLNKLLYSCLRVNILGSQIHLDSNSFNNDNYVFKHLRLGKIRKHKSAIEPYIRNCDFCYFNLNAVRKSDAPGKTGTNPSGLMSEEASQIARYAGLSEKLSHFVVGGFWHIESQTAELISQMLWYFMEGYSKRTSDDVESNREIQEYIVNLQEPHLNLTFLKSEKTGRWWFKIKTEVNNQSIYKNIPCTYQDYQSACNDEVTELILEAIDNH